MIDFVPRQRELVLLGNQFESFIKNDFLSVLTTIGEIFKHDKAYPEKMFGSMTKNIM
jgi:hypothetical protein